MNIITGGTGHVGAALAKKLLAMKEDVTIISRSSKDAKQWESKGVKIAVADIYDTAALHEIFKTGTRIFILNPPADIATDTDLQERKTITSLVNALKHSGAQKVVVESTMGAQKGELIGDLGTLYDLEQQIKKLSYSYSIIRPAYYMSNWLQSLPIIKEKGEMMSCYPADLKFPMVAPVDIGELAAELMTENNASPLNMIQGPELYSANDVADAFSETLNKKIDLKIIPETDWIETYLSLGFSKAAAESYSNMTKISLVEFQKSMPTENVIKCKTTLKDYINGALKDTIAN